MARMRTAGILLFLRVFFLGSFGTFINGSSQLPSSSISISMPGNQSTPSIILDGSTSAAFPSPILISASETVLDSYGTTISVSSEVSSTVPGIQSTPSIILVNSTSVVVPTQSLIYGACTPPGEYINASSGHISSPNFPNNYEANRTCTWNITVLIGKIIKVTFLNFTLVAGENSNCTGAAAGSARVFITNVSSHEGNRDDFKICGQELPPTVYSKGNSIQVRFESRHGTLNKGFNATFEAIDENSTVLGSYGTTISVSSEVSSSYVAVPGIQSTPSLPLDSSTSAVVPLPSLNSASESCSGTTISVSSEVTSSVPDIQSTASLLLDGSGFSASESSSGTTISVSSEVSSSVPDIQSTASLLLDGSTSAVVPSPILISASESSFSTTISVSSEVSSSVPDIQSTASLPLDGSTSTNVPLPSLISASESSFGTTISVSSEVTSSVPSIQTTSSIILNSSTPAVVPTQSPIFEAIPPASILYPYGTQQEDNEFGLDDFPYYYSDLCLRINTDWTGIPFFSERLYKLYICRNGLIQLDFEWSWWWPRKFGIYWWLRNMGIIAPFWAITDTYLPFKYNHSKVYYQVYSQTQNKSSEILDLATRHVQDYIEGFGDFRASWVLVVTWEKLCPYSYYSYYYYSSEQNFQLNCPRSNTFQAVLITNGFNAFLMYNYPSKGIQWLVNADPEYYRYWTDFYGLPVAGWNAGNDGKNFVNLKGSGTFGLSDLDKEVGNTGLVGRHFWRIENSDGQGALEKCLSWVLQNKAWKFLERYNELIKSDSEMACPCTGWQAIFDWGRFRWNWWNSWPEFCFESRSFRSFKINTTSGPLDFQLRQKCCYSTDWQDWGSLKRGPPDGGRVDVTFRYDSNNSFYTDEQAYKSCCVDSLNCRLFYDLRPSDSCSNYVPRPRRWFWGDPHIKTLDGGNYTFNGLGEYTMVDAKNGTFKLQARTKLAQGNSTTATIFSAGAAKEENSSTIEVRVKDGGGFDILIDSASYDGYNDLTNQSVDVGGNLSFSKPKENCLQVSFLSTSSVQFCEKKEMMSFVVTLGNDFKNATKGLLGTWNGDPKDDFTLPDGTVLPSSSTLSEIHFHFGVKWQINQSQSLFTYAKNESVATFSKLDFMPMFADNITWHNDSLRQKAEAQCGDDHECLFDVASTKDLSIGSATKEISVQLVNDTKKLNNFPPKIENTSEVINVTLHEIVELNITAVDDGTITFRVINKPVGATWNQTGAVLLFYWNVISSKKFSLTFVAVDDQDASAIWSPTIKMCACQHDGQCVEPEEGDANNTDSKFIYMGCECQGGYTGRFCDRDIDACEVNGQPCYAGVDCTDLPPPANSSGYQCGPCPSGYTGDGAQCVDIDECRSDPCTQKCVNVPASFFCDCDNGYKLKDDGRSCDDINECLPTNDCMQKCNNSVGSYNCSCDEYFKTDPTDWRKCVAKNPCTSDYGCSHVCFTGSSGRATCACYANFELQSDGKTCKDINECDPAKELHRCSQTCINTEGSYNCSCTEGYELKKDGYECEDINECLNDDLYSCTDDFHKCVNTRGSYRCECEQDLYFIDGKCQGLEKNPEPPKQPPPKPKNASENEKEQAVQFSIPSRVEWDFNRDKSFKEVLASVASEFCRENRTKCGLKNTRRKRRSLYDIYTADEVHLLPGYPKNSSDSLQVAFYVKQPAGGFIGNNSVLHRDTLVAIIIDYKSDIEKAIGANITDIETLFKPSTTTESPTAGPAEPADDDWKWIVIGVVIGVVVIIILIGLLIFCMRKRKRDVKPITDPSQEGIAAQQSGLMKENSFESGSHSA